MTMKPSILCLVFWCVAPASAVAQWNPGPGWEDSYAVDGVCYCDSSNYDHNLDSKSADTPIGRLNVVRICEDIKAALGTGSPDGRIPYNDVQCGNGPANDAADEAGCPGRTDIGSAGCNVIGPTWDLEAVYGTGASVSQGSGMNGGTSASQQGGSTNAIATADDDEGTAGGNSGEALGNAAVGGTTASHNPDDAKFAFDGNVNTRWTTREYQTPGQVFQLDLGRSRTVGRVILDTQRSNNDDPDGYRLSTSTDGRAFTVAATGSGQGGITTIDFTDRAVRHVRLTQTGSKSGNWWSIHEISVSKGDASSNADNPGNISLGDDDVSSGSNADGGNIDDAGNTLDRSNWTLIASTNNGETSNAIDGSASSRWSTRHTQRDGQWFEIDLSKAESFTGIVLDSELNGNDGPRQYTLLVSDDGSGWTTVATGTGDSTTTMTFSRRTARYIRIQQDGSDSSHWWSIHEIDVTR